MVKLRIRKGTILSPEHSMCKSPKVQEQRPSSNRKKFSVAGTEWIFKMLVSDEVAKVIRDPMRSLNQIREVVRVHHELPRKMNEFM